MMERCRKLEESIGKGVLAEFLRKNRDEVRDMILTEYNEQKHIENEKNGVTKRDYSWARKSVKHEEDGWVKKLEKCKQLRI